MKIYLNAFPKLEPKGSGSQWWISARLFRTHIRTVHIAHCTQHPVPSTHLIIIRLQNYANCTLVLLLNYSAFRFLISEFKQFSIWPIRYVVVIRCRCRCFFFYISFIFDSQLKKIINNFNWIAFAMPITLYCVQFALHMYLCSSFNFENPSPALVTILKSFYIVFYATWALITNKVHIIII